MNNLEALILQRVDQGGVDARLWLIWYPVLAFKKPLKKYHPVRFDWFTLTMFLSGGLASGEIQDKVDKQYEDKFEQMINGEMAMFLVGLKTNAPNLERVVQEGMVREVIQRQTGRQKPDLLVIGTHGRTGVAHAFLGSVAEDLLKDPPCDVLAVKAW